MASGSTQHSFHIELSDIDRGVYESLALQVSRHPSESAGYLVARVLAYALEYEEGIAFSSGGLSSPEEPALSIRDLTGALMAWIEVGTPGADRLHKATKACERVVVYCHKDLQGWFQAVAGSRVHDPKRLRIAELDRALVDGLVARLDRRNRWVLSRSEGELYLEVEGETLSAHLRYHPWP